jgi:uroporphyrin-III C-methyltransferase/precorrin-2 dehydrogenase/sirohydrochlorin ferrochelatase
MKNKVTLPVLLTNPKFLIIGGGNVALQKAKALKKNNIKFKLISPIVKNEIYKYCKNIKIKKFKLKDIKNYTYIINATGNNKITKKLLKYKKRNNILLNIVNDPKLCDFYFMATTSNKNLQIAISTNGFSPKLAIKYRDKCQKIIPKNINKLLKKSYKIRKTNIKK